MVWAACAVEPTACQLALADAVQLDLLRAVDAVGDSENLVLGPHAARLEAHQALA